MALTVFPSSWTERLVEAVDELPARANKQKEVLLISVSIPADPAYRS